MKILVTGSSGYLGTALVTKLQSTHDVIGIDVMPSSTTKHVGSVANREFIANVFDEYRGFNVIFHAAALHQPNIKTHTKSEFIDTNVTGTLNLFEEATITRETRTKCFIFTSTTSLMISSEIRRQVDEHCATKVHWISEETCSNPMPRNIYGVTKLSAEHLLRILHTSTGLPCIILRTSRFFPEDDNQPSVLDHTDISEVNRKLNEFMFRRVSLEDVVDAHLLAMEKAEIIQFDHFIISAQSPFQIQDVEALEEENGLEKMLSKKYPKWKEHYEKLGFKIPRAADRIYSCEKAMLMLGYSPKWSFQSVVEHFVEQENELVIP
jgi:UDP-glucose 4-epimerase